MIIFSSSCHPLLYSLCPVTSAIKWECAKSVSFPTQSLHGQSYFWYFQSVKTTLDGGCAWIHHLHLPYSYFLRKLKKKNLPNHKIIVPTNVIVRSGLYSLSCTSFSPLFLSACPIPQNLIGVQPPPHQLSAGLPSPALSAAVLNHSRLEQNPAQRTSFDKNVGSVTYFKLIKEICFSQMLAPFLSYLHMQIYACVWCGIHLCTNVHTICNQNKCECNLYEKATADQIK